MFSPKEILAYFGVEVIGNPVPGCVDLQLGCILLECFFKYHHTCLLLIRTNPERETPPDLT